MESVTDADVSDQGFPFGCARNLKIAGIDVLAIRLTYVGELGWELHFPVENARSVYQALMSAGEEYGITNAGYRAIESLRLEKAYRAWGSDLSPDHTPLEAGLGFAVKLKSGLDFIGRDALYTAIIRGLAGSLVEDTVIP
jgi:4-methylaminobutanoate oxidase (formaldehyde-forming)